MVAITGKRGPKAPARRHLTVTLRYRTALLGIYSIPCNLQHRITDSSLWWRSVRNAPINARTCCAFVKYTIAYVRGYTMIVNRGTNGMRMEDVWLDK